MRDGFIPEQFKNKPELDFRLDFFLKSFWRLGSCRDFSGYGITPIKWTAIKEMAVHYEMGFDETEDFFEIIESLDSCYMELVRSKDEPKTIDEDNPKGSNKAIKNTR